MLKGNLNLQEKICFVCEGKFFPCHRRQILCSEVCVKERHRQLSFERRKKKSIEQKKLRTRARCIICDKKYKKKISTQLTCSKACSYQNSVNLANEWSKQALARDPTFNKKKRHKRIVRAVEPKMKHCKICHKPITKPIGRTKTCSVKCRLLNNKEIARQADLKSKWKAKFEKWWKQNKDEILSRTKECIICQKTFTFTTNQKTCSYKCFKELEKQRHAIKYQNTREEQIKRKLEWQKNNREKFNAYRKEWRKAKKKKITIK